MSRFVFILLGLSAYALAATYIVNQVDHDARVEYAQQYLPLETTKRFKIYAELNIDYTVNQTIINNMIALLPVQMGIATKTSSRCFSFVRYEQANILDENGAVLTYRVAFIYDIVKQSTYLPGRVAQVLYYQSSTNIANINPQLLDQPIEIIPVDN